MKHKLLRLFMLPALTYLWLIGWILYSTNHSQAQKRKAQTRGQPMKHRTGA
jgi:hypothetical protein